MEVRFEDNTDIVRNELGQIMTRIPETEAELSEEMMEIAVEEIEKSFRLRFEDFTGQVRRQISMDKVVPASASEGQALKLPLEGDTPRGIDYLRWHETADKGHWVSVSKDNAPIYEWAQQTFEKPPSAVKVSPRPFIKPALKRMRRKMEQKAQGEDNAVQDFADEIEEIN